MSPPRRHPAHYISQRGKAWLFGIALVIAAAAAGLYYL